MDMDGGNQVQITDAKKGYAYNPCWSPDGKRIIFDAYKKDKKDTDLYIIDVDQPYWSPDGYVYFVSDRGNKKENYQIWRFKLDDE